MPPKAALTIDYRAATAEALADAGETFDVILNMEVVEHVADVELFVAKCAEMVRPGGIMFVATINRTLKALGLAIIGAEYVLRWLPRGTHQYGKLVRPEELETALADAGMAVVDRTGVVYNPLADRWQRSARHGRQLHGDGGAAPRPRRFAPERGLRKLAGRAQLCSSGSTGIGMKSTPSSARARASSGVASP